MFPFKFPYTNFHELNLDWLLETVKSNTDRIAANELKIKLLGGDDPLNALYPVGSMFISAESTSPASIFGGEWEQIGGRFLIGADATYSAGSTGGSNEVTINRTNMPTNTYAGTVLTEGGSYWTIERKLTTQNKDDFVIMSVNDIGPSEEPMNNIPPYLSVYMWKRVN